LFFFFRLTYLDFDAVRGCEFAIAFGFAISLLFFFLDTLVYFFAMHGNILWRIDSYPYLITFNAQNGYRYVIPDDQRLTHTPG